MASSASDPVADAVPLKTAINAVLGDKYTIASSRRVVDLKELGKTLLGAIDKESLAIQTLSAELSCALRDILQTTVKYRSLETKRGNLWAAFHQLSISQIPKIWNKCFVSLEIQVKDTLLQQSVSQKLFEMLLVENISQTSMNSDHSTSKRSDHDQFGKDELNVLRYACGYVPHTLLKRYEKRSDCKYANFIECLRYMAVQCDQTDHDMLQYTKEWMDKVDRGGLFPLNDSTYLFFLSIEKVVRHVLPNHMTQPLNSVESFQKSVIQTITKDEVVQGRWTLLSQCIDSEEDAIELLKEIVTLWVTVRGFSITATWMEVYKKRSKRKIKKRMGLRKGLNQSS